MSTKIFVIPLLSLLVLLSNAHDARNMLAFKCILCKILPFLNSMLSNNAETSKMDHPNFLLLKKKRIIFRLSTYFKKKRFLHFLQSFFLFLSLSGYQILLVLQLFWVFPIRLCNTHILWY